MTDTLLSAAPVETAAAPKETKAQKIERLKREQNPWEDC